VKGDGITWPRIGDEVTVSYRAQIAETKQVFDSTAARGVDFTFTLGVNFFFFLAGWTKETF
jgi:FKBP-type peptidyl-prolyl cis-trans isomerase